MLGVTWRGVFSFGLAALLTVALVPVAQAQAPATTPQAPATAPKPTAAKPTAAAPHATAARKLAPAQPAKKLAASPVKKTPTKTLASAVKKPATATKLAKTAAPSHPVTAAVVTTAHGNVTRTATRTVSPPSTSNKPVIAASTAALAPTHGAPPQATQTGELPAKSATSGSTASPAETHAKPPEQATQIAALPVSLTTPHSESATQVQAKPTAPPAASTTPVATSPAGAAGFVATFLRDAFHIARSDGTTSLQRRAQLADLFAQKMDVRWIAGYTTGTELTDATPETQQHFRTILISYLVETYYPRLELASDPAVKIETAAEPQLLADNTAVVWTTFSKEGWGSQSIKWRVLAEDGSFKVVDILSAGASLVQMERDTFLSVMRNGGLNELMAKLDARTKALAGAATE